MATVNKDFKVKHGLVVEGTTGTIDGNDILTKNTDSDNYIIDLIGGETLITSVESTQMEVVNGELNIKSGVFDVDGAAATAETNANTYTDTALEDYTPTASLETTLDGYGYLKSDDLPTMYSDSDVDAHLSGGDGITYSTGTISADVAGGLHIDNAQIKIDRTTVDTWYDASGAAGDVAQDLSDHESDTSTHGVTGTIVGTSDTQTLSNKTFSDSLHFQDGVNNYSAIYANANDLKIDGSNDIVLTTNNGDIVLNPDGAAYIGSASAENEIATHSYVDNAVSGLNWKQAVNLLAHTNISLTGNATTTSVDGHSLSTADGYRILLTGQSTDTEDGIYDIDVTSGTYTFTRSADADTNDELIGAAVFVMEGTTYGGSSWVQGDHYITGFASQDWTQFSGSGTVTAGTGIIVDGLEVSVDTDVIATQIYADGAVGTHSDYTSNIHGVTGNVVGTTDSQTLTNKTIDGGDNTLSNIPNSSLTNSSITVNGYATSLGDTVTLDTDDVSEGTNQYFTQTRARDSFSAGNAISYNSGTGEIAVDASQLDSDDISEGSTNLYYTDSRAKAEAAALLTNATKTNITITADGSNNLTITAENGVADSDTDDLTEGSSNLYFTDQRVIDAIDNSVINPQVVEINMIARQVAAIVEDITTATTVTGYAFAKADYRSAEFLVKVAYGAHTEISKVLLTLDTSDNIAITEYGIVGTNGSAMVVSADISGTDVRLRVQTLNNNSTVTVMGTLLV